MPIVAGDIVFHLSGGSGNTDPNASLGGARATQQITSASLHNLFDVVSSAESAAGDTEYRCFYVRNAHGSLPLQNTKIYISANTPDTETAVRIALGTSAVNGTEQTIADESTPPTGVTWSTAANLGAALAIGDLLTTEHKAIWVEWVVDPAAAAYNADSVVFDVVGDTAA